MQISKENKIHRIIRFINVCNSSRKKHILWNKICKENKKKLLN